MEIAITESINKMKMEMNQEQGNYKEREVSAREKEVDLKKMETEAPKNQWDGSMRTFRTYEQGLEGFYIQNNASFLFNPTFQSLWA